MASSNAVTSSAALTELQSNLTQLSSTLHEVYEMMNTDMSHVGQAWQDGKYQEFVDGYKPQIQKCEVISEQYKLWCTKVLAPTIENVMAVERTDVGNGGGSVGGVSTGGADTMDGTGSSGATTMGAVSGRFNMGGQKPAYQNPSSKVIADIDNFLNRPTRDHIKLSEADIRCQEKFGANYHGIPSTREDAHVSWGGNTPSNKKITSGIELDLGIIKGKLGSEAGDGTSSPEGWAQCEKD